MKKTYKYQVGEIAFKQMVKSDQVQYKPIYQYKHQDHGIWVDCNNNSTVEYVLLDIDVRVIYRLKQI